MSVETTMTEENKLYNEGYDDGVEGRVRKSMDPSYLEGYYDGVEEAEETDYDDYAHDYFDCSGCEGCAWDDEE